MGLLSAAVVLAAPPATAVSLHPGSPASDFDVLATGAASDQLPSALSAGDWNGDGYGDVLACSWVNDSCAIFLGRTGAPGWLNRPDVVLVGPAGTFGGGAAFLGDINDDGFDDVGIGSPTLTAYSTAPRAGGLWIFTGRSFTPGGSVGYYLANVSIFATTQNAEFGATVAPAGDMTGDGIDDFWVSAPNQPASGSNWGVLYLFAGNRTLGPMMNDLDFTRQIVGVTPATSGRPLLLGGRDIDGDGRSDLVFASTDYTDASGFRVGAAVVFLGPLPPSPSVLTPADADSILWGATTVTSFGRAIEFADDFAADGTRTLFVGADRYDNSTGQGGAIYMFDTANLGCCASLYPWDADGLIYSPGTADKLGSALAVADFDGDGRSDLVAGAPDTWVGGGARTGRVFVFWGGEVGAAPVVTTDAPVWVNGPRRDALFGSLLVATDFDGDGKTDFFAGAPTDASAGAASGSVYGYYGRLRNRSPTLTVTAPATAFEGQPIIADLTWNDPDLDRLTWFWDLGGATAYSSLLNAAKVNFSYPNQGTFQFRVELTDGEFVVNVTLSITVENVAPSCELRAVAPFVEGRRGTVAANITEPGDDPLEIEWAGPAGMEFNASDPTRVAYTPGYGASFAVQLWVADDLGATGTCRVDVPVVNLPPEVFIDGPTEFHEGETALFVATATDAGAQDTVNFTWRTPEGQEEGSVLSWLPTHVGFVDIHLTGTDRSGAQDTATIIVHVLSRPPAVTLFLPAGVREGESANLSVVQLSGADYDTLTFDWQVCGGARTGQRPGGYVLTRAVAGECVVRVTVLDDDGEKEDLVGILTVENRPPAIQVTANPAAPYSEDQRVEFAVVLAPWESASTAGMRFVWRLDGVVVDGHETLSLRLPGGVHNITAQVEDPLGARSVVSLEVFVQNRPPEVLVQGPTAVQVGQVATWLASATDPPADDVAFVWEVDGVRFGQGRNLTWSGSSPGTHTLRVTATDPAGGTSQFDFTVEVIGGTAAGWTDVPTVALGAVGALAFAGGLLFGGKALDRLRGRRRDG